MAEESPINVAHTVRRIPPSSRVRAFFHIKVVQLQWFGAELCHSSLLQLRDTSRPFQTHRAGWNCLARYVRTARNIDVLTRSSSLAFGAVGI